MSFRTAYYGLKSTRRTNRSQGYLRDPSPQEWKKIMDEYYIQQQKTKKQ